MSYETGIEAMSQIMLNAKTEAAARYKDGRHADVGFALHSANVYIQVAAKEMMAFGQYDAKISSAIGIRNNIERAIQSLAIAAGILAERIEIRQKGETE